MKKARKQAEEQLVFPPPFFPNEISINDRINNELVEKTIKTIDDLVNVYKYKKIFIFLDSPGGDFFSSQRMFGKFLDIRRKVETIGVAGGKLHSAAAMVFQGFGLRLIRLETKMILHDMTIGIPPIDFIPYKTSEEEKLADVKEVFINSYLMQDYIDYTLMGKTGMSKEETREMLKKGTTLNAEQILKYNLADGFYNPAYHH